MKQTVSETVRSDISIRIKLESKLQTLYQL